MEAMTIPAVVADTVSGCFDVVVDLERVVSSIRGLQAQVLDRAIRVSGLGSIASARGVTGGLEMKVRALRAELAAALKIPERTAETQLAVSEFLVNDLPNTLAALSAGEIVGRDSYRVPQDLKNWLQVRDVTCRFPGCSRHAARCEIDHTQDWAHDGHTRHDNLAHLCKSHHLLKHKTDRQVAQARDGTGTLTWTSPAGRDYVTEPETQMRP
jgi:hypothetical protein